MNSKTLIYNLLVNFVNVTNSLYGWALGVLGTVLTFFAPEKYAFYCVLAAIFLDALFGTIKAFKMKTFIVSKLMSRTLFKIAAYFAALIMVFLLEKLAHDGGFVGVKVAAGWAIACEFWSMSASILIIWPDAPFFHVMRKHLKGEIAAKLGQDVADVLDEKKIN